MQIMTNTLIKSDNDFIYCLYKNKPLIDEKTNLPVYTNKINVYNWSGNPVAQLNFNHPVQTFTIDRKNNKIITYAPDMDSFMVYNYPDEIKKFK